MSMMKETDQTLLQVNASRILEAFLDKHITAGEAVADLTGLCRIDMRHINGPSLTVQLRQTLDLAASEEIDANYALTHLVRLATATVLFVDRVVDQA